MSSHLHHPDTWIRGCPPPHTHTPPPHTHTPLPPPSPPPLPSPPPPQHTHTPFAKSNGRLFFQTQKLSWWYFMGFPCATALSKCVLSVSIKTTTSFIPEDYKINIQTRLDYGITLYCFSTQKNIDLVQRVQNHAARLITGTFEYINCRGIDLIKSLNLYAICESRDYFLTILMSKAYPWDRANVPFRWHCYEFLYINGFDNRGSDMDFVSLYTA